MIFYEHSDGESNDSLPLHNMTEEFQEYEKSIKQEELYQNSENYFEEDFYNNKNENKDDSANQKTEDKTSPKENKPDLKEIKEPFISINPLATHSY